MLLLVCHLWARGPIPDQRDDPRPHPSENTLTTALPHLLSHRLISSFHLLGQTTPQMWHQVVARHLIMTQHSRILRTSVEDGSLDVDSEMTVVSSRRVPTKSHYMPLEAKDIFYKMMEKGLCVHDISERGCNR